MFKIRKIKIKEKNPDIEYNMSIKKIYKFFITNLKVYDSFEIAKTSDYTDYEYKCNKFFKC